jgi:hypothetical protein
MYVFEIISALLLAGAGDAAFQRLEQELDWEELDLQQLAPADDTGGAS